VTPTVIKPVVLLTGLICNERAHDADVCDPVCNDFEPICNDCEPKPKTQLQSICARLSDDCDPAAGCLQVVTPTYPSASKSMKKAGELSRFARLRQVKYLNKALTR